jgi:hypothetical protein
MRLKLQKQSALKFVSQIIPPQAEDIEDIRGIPGTVLVTSAESECSETRSAGGTIPPTYLAGTWDYEHINN